MENKAKINIKGKNKWFFYFDNLNFDSFNEFEEFKIYHIIYFYSNLIFDNKKNIDKTIKIGFLKEFFDFINNSKEVLLYADTFMNIFKLSIILKVEPKSINSVGIREIETNLKIMVQPEYYLTAEEIDELKIRRTKIIFFINNYSYLFKL